MSKAKNDKAQTPAVVIDESGEAAQPVQTVTGRRLGPRETFVVASPPAPAPEEDDPAIPCAYCRKNFLQSEWEDNGDACPNCDRGVADLEIEPEPELSEAEILLRSIANDEEYSLRVDRLINYENDGRTDSRAERRFCTTLKPVTLDYLDTVRRAFGGGVYLFSMYRRTRGLVKVWHEVIEKPLVTEAPPPTTVPTLATTAPAADPLRATLEKLILRRMEAALNAMDKPQPPPLIQAPIPPPPEPEDEDTIAAKLIFKNPAVVDRLADRFNEALGAPPEHWASALIREGVKQLPQILAAVNARTPQTPRANPAPPNPTPASVVQPEAAPPPQPHEAVIELIVDQLTRDLSVDQSVNATLEFIRSYPQWQGFGAMILQYSAVELIQQLAQQKPEWSYLSKLAHAAEWIETFQAELADRFEKGGNEHGEEQTASGEANAIDAEQTEVGKPTARTDRTVGQSARATNADSQRASA